VYYAEGAVARSQTMPRDAPGRADFLEDQEDFVPTSFPGFSADATSTVRGQLPLLNNSFAVAAGLPPGVIAGANMHRREALSYTNHGMGSMQIPTSGSDDPVIFPKRTSPRMQPSGHNASRPLTESAVLSAGTDVGTMHASMPVRPFTDTACVAGRNLLNLNGVTDRGIRGDLDQSMTRQPSWSGVSCVRSAGPTMCCSSTGSANRGHAVQNAMHPQNASRSSPGKGSGLAAPIETLRLTHDMMFSGNFPGRMGRVAGVQQLQQVQQHQLMNDGAARERAAARKQASQEQSASYLNGTQGTQLPASSAELRWGMHATKGTEVAMNGDREFLQGSALSFSAGGHTHTSHTHSDVSQLNGMLPISVDRMSDGESDFDDDHEQGEQDGFSPHQNVLEKNHKAVSPLRTSVQGISTPEKPNSSLRDWSGYGARRSSSGPMSMKGGLSDSAPLRRSSCVDQVILTSVTVTE
jgi:hypothetical protein